MWTIDTAAPWQHSFSARARNGTFERKARLTYDLMSGEAHRRDLILFTKSKDEKLPVLEKHGVGLEKLEREIADHERVGRTVLEAVKSVANAVHERRLPLESVSLAVHRFGPVPVYVIPDAAIPVELFGVERSCRVGIYPALRNDREVSKFLSGTRSNYQYISSLGIELDLVLKRYLEDAGEYSFDLEHHSSLEEVFGAAKKIEEVLGESVNKKYQDIVRPTKIRRDGTPASPRVLAEAQAIRLSYADNLIEAQLARCVFLLCLNTIYGAIGFRNRVDHYIQKWDGYPQSVHDSFGKDMYDNARSNLRSVAMMERAVNSLRGAEIVEVPPKEETERALWLRRLMQFARFASLIQHRTAVEGWRGPKPRLFMSHQFTDSTAQLVARVVEDTLEEDSKKRVMPFSVQEEDVGSPFPDHIRVGIWLSAALASVVPTRPRRIGSSKRSSFWWIAREAEHGLLLRRRLVPFVEEGAEVEQVIKECRRPSVDFFLSAEARRSKGWAADLARTYSERIVIRFQGQVSGKKAPGGLRDRILTEAEAINEEFLRRILRGLLSQFSRGTVGVFAKTHAATRLSPMTRKEIVKVVPGFTQAYLRSKERFLEICGKPRRLIELTRRRGLYSYRGGLGDIIKALRPDLVEVEQYVVNVFKAYVQP